MERKIFYVIVMWMSVSLLGCHTTLPRNVEEKESMDEARSALTSIATAVSKRELSDEEVHNFEKQIVKDKDAQSAVQAISDSMSGKNVNIKYCPVCGRRYDPKVQECPIDKVRLEYIE